MPCQFSVFSHDDIFFFCVPWQLLHGPESLGGLLTGAGYKTVPSDSPDEKPVPESQEYFRGGYTVQTYGSKDGGEVDAIQIEVQSEIRYKAYQ